MRFTVLVASFLLPTFLTAQKGEYFVYFGTYTREQSKGIYVARLRLPEGKLGPAELAAETSNPSFLTLHPNRRLLYAVGELYGQGQKAGAVSAFSIDPGTGRLTLLNQVSSRGTGPCHLSVDPTGKALVVVNYGSGSTAAFPIRDDGSLSEAASVIQHQGSSVDPKRQQGPHAHSVNVSANSRFAIVADLGLDQVLVYRLDPATAVLTPNEPPYVTVKPGGGPRHFAFHPSGRFGYVIQEMGSSVTAFSWDAARGVFKELQTITTLPEGFSGTNHCAEVQVHPSGRFLYGSNRGHDSIAVFSIDTRKGTLTPLGHTPTQGKIPRSFGIDPTGSVLIAANQNSNNVVVFRIDGKTGRLTPTGQTLELGAPVCVRFLAVK